MLFRSGLSLGVFSLGGISIGLLALGGLALGGLSLGGVSVGILSLGACAIGHYAAGATAVGSALAVGVAAVSPGVEVGLDTSGRAALSLLLEPLWDSGATLDQVTAQVSPYLPGTPVGLIRLLLRLGGLS